MPTHSLKVLMISIDKGLLGGRQLGDVVERHIAYAAHPAVERLDIIVLSRGNQQPYQLSPKSTAYPTNSRSKLRYYRDGLNVGWRLGDQHAYDLVITQEPFVTGLIGLRLKQRLGMKLLVHHHGDFFENSHWIAEHPIKHRVLRWVAKRVTRAADGVRAMSQGIAHQVGALGIAANRIRVLPTPINLAKFQAEPVGSNHIVLTVGRRDRAKDFPTLYRAMRIVFARQPQALLWQVGANGVTEAEVRDLTGGSAQQVRVTPQVDQRELVNCYAACDVYVSSSAHESFGKVLVEANACVKPVVATATTGAKDIIQDGVNGFLVPVGDSAALAEKIIHLLQHPNEAKAMGQRGRQLVAERFDGAKSTQAIVQFWQDLVAGRLAPPDAVSNSRELENRL